MASEHEAAGNGTVTLMVGLMAGAVVGAGIGVLFAPKKGSETRRLVSDEATHVGRLVTDRYRLAFKTMRGIGERCASMCGKTAAAAPRAADNTTRFVREMQHGLVMSGRDSSRPATVTLVD